MWVLNNFFIDLDECRSVTINDCDFNVLCINMEGFYVCCCFKGFRGDGKMCIGRVVILIIYCNVNDLISDFLSCCIFFLLVFVYKVFFFSFCCVFVGNSIVNYGEVVWIFFFLF